MNGTVPQLHPTTTNDTPIIKSTLTNKAITTASVMHEAITFLDVSVIPDLRIDFNAPAEMGQWMKG
jgi:hypothetical protein